MILPLQQSSLPPKRGAFLLLEGVDRCGKTTQSQLLLQRLLAAGIAAVALRFPDRSTSTGAIINSYLQQTTAALDDRAIHLLFSANRWESAATIVGHLRAGTTIVCDRYAYSGVAFSAAKVNEKKEPVLDLEWCKAPDRGLPAPDCVLFLDVSPEEAERRGGYGGERYETRDMQIRVREQFARLQTMDTTVPWTLIDAAQTQEKVHSDIWNEVEETIGKCAHQPIKAMWQPGAFEQ